MANCPLPLININMAPCSQEIYGGSPALYHWAARAGSSPTLGLGHVLASSQLPGRAATVFMSMAITMAMAAAANFMVTLEE